MMMDKNIKFKSTMHEVANEFVCPISHELPVDPVTAEDGRIYERGAIELWFSTGDCTSPMTNEVMGTRLLPAVQCGNMLRCLVQNGAVDEDIAGAWMKKIAEEAKVASSRLKAEDGDSESMYKLGSWYTHGVNGLDRDNVLAFKWYQLSAELDNANGLASCGQCYLDGKGVGKDIQRGLVMIGQAVGRSAHACYVLGFTYHHGNGVSKDATETFKWYKKALNFRDGCSTNAVKYMEKWLLNTRTVKN